MFIFLWAYIDRHVRIGYVIVFFTYRPTDDKKHNTANDNASTIKQALREAATNAPASHVTLTFDILTLKVVSESCVTWATSVPILVFLGLSVLDLGPMYATDVRQTDVRRASSLNAPSAGGIINTVIS